VTGRSELARRADETARRFYDEQARLRAERQRRENALTETADGHRVSVTPETGGRRDNDPAPATEVEAP
jgi:hypothetical protein